MQVFFGSSRINEHQVLFNGATEKVCILCYKTNLFPHAHETLAYLQSKYQLHLISNGFKESQDTKINGTGIGKYFTHVIHWFRFDKNPILSIIHFFFLQALRAV